MRLGLGSELGAIDIDRPAKLDLFRRDLEGVVEEMKSLRQGEPEAVVA
jgi:hypothetical protein